MVEDAPDPTCACGHAFSVHFRRDPFACTFGIFRVCCCEAFVPASWARALSPTESREEHHD